MNREELANLFRLAKLVGGKFIIVEEGKPSVVLMDYKEFSELAVSGIVDKLTNKIESVNREITTAQLQDLREEVIADGLEIPPDITIEPLGEFDGILDPH